MISTMQPRTMFGARNKFGNAIAAALGQADPGAVPGREPWSVNPALDTPSRPTLGPLLEGALATSADGKPVVRVQQPDGSVVGDRPALPAPPGIFGNRGSPATPPIAPGPLGNSMRQPFDYDAARATLAGPQKKIKDWQWILGGIADVAASFGGGQPSAIRNLIQQRNGMRERAFDADKKILDWRRDDYQASRDADLRAAAPFSSGRDRVQFDPASGQSRVIYDGAEDFETYADKLGLQPGTQPYFDAVEDYVLRSNGPTAFEYDKGLEAIRHANRLSAEAARQSNRIGLEGVRDDNRRGLVDYRNANPPPARPRAPARSGSARPSIVKVKTPAEAARLAPGTRFQTPDGRIKVR